MLCHFAKNDSLGVQSDEDPGECRECSLMTSPIQNGSKSGVILTHRGEPTFYEYIVMKRH